MSRPRLLVVAHDAGGAEIVSAWLRRHLDEWDSELVLDGPAVAIFARKLGDRLPRHGDLPALDGVSLVLCGSSATAPLERRAVRAARAAGVRCAVWLDHWTNYVLRFTAVDGLVLPDEVWVADEYAAVLARAELPGADIRLKGNPYLEDFAAEVSRLEDRRGVGAAAVERILYVTEPISAAAERATGDPDGWGYTEFDALRRYLAELAGREGAPVELRLRAHPSEPPAKYDGVLSEADGRIVMRAASGASLAEDVAWADTVVGCDTMALVAALAAGRRAISVLPREAGGVSLPHPEIERPLG
jgi:hypothetical protein